jgi:uncharacterized protein
MQCPVDNTRLEISERQGIEIDYCPTCRGVWLDRGELDKLIDRQAGFSQSRHEERDERRDEYRESRNRRDFDDDDDDYRHNNGHHGDKRHKKEGFLGDLFDF